MKKIFSLLLIAACAMAAGAATKYEINVAGVEVTSDNCTNVTGGDIGGGTVYYDPSSNTLTLSNVTINRYDDSGKYCVHNRKCDNLTIKFLGTCKLYSEKGPALKLQRNTELMFSGTSSIRSYTNNAVAIDNNYSVTISGNGTANFEATAGSADCIKGGGSNTKLNFHGSYVTVKSAAGYGLNSLQLYFSYDSYFNYSTDLLIYANGQKQSVYNCTISKDSRVAILEPYEAYYSESGKTIYTGLGQTITSLDIYISSTYGAIINSSYFPDYNFRQALLSLYPKGWMTSSELSSRTSLTVSNNHIYSLDGVSYFTNLSYLDCSNNYISDIPTLPSGFKELNISNNHITYADNACSSIQYLDLSYNFLSTISTSRFSSLKSLNVSYNTSLTSVNCSDKVLTSLDVRGCSKLNTLDCRNNQLTSLNLSGCSSLTMLTCFGNNISSISSLPSSVQELYCYNNNLSGTLDLSGRSALKRLNCDNNHLSSLNIQGCHSLESVHCGSNNLTSLSFHGLSSLSLFDCQLNYNLKTIQCNSNPNLETLQVRNCSALTELICNNNAIEELDLYGVNNLTKLNCNYNKLVNLNVANKTKLTDLMAGYNQLTSINVSGCTSLQWLECEVNKLSSLSVQGCNALRTIYCCVNQLKESGTGVLVSSLCTIPAGSSGNLFFVSPGYTYNGLTEGNVITNAQVRTARNKRWIPKKQVSGNWVEIPVSITGDVNGDGYVTSADVTAVYDVMLGTNNQFATSADVNGDGYVTSADVTAIYDIMLGN